MFKRWSGDVVRWLGMATYFTVYVKCHKSIATPLNDVFDQNSQSHNQNAVPTGTGIDIIYRQFRHVLTPMSTFYRYIQHLLHLRVF